MKVKREALPSGLCLAMLLGGCPKRQTSPNVVYVPSPPPPASKSAAAPAPEGAIVVEEPRLPKPEEKPLGTVPEGQGGQKPTARVRRRPVSAEPSAEEATVPEQNDHPAAPVPALQLGESPQQQNELRHRVQTIDQGVEARIARFERTKGRRLDPNTLEGARAFLAQSRRALQDGDLQRAFNLARKASLLVDGLEQKP